METTKAKRILVVEDNEAYRDMIRLRLELNGYEVVTASDGVTGLEMARKANPDLVILDLTLPEVLGVQNSREGLDRRSGHKICRMIKFDHHLKHIPLLILTSSDEREDTALAVRSGADAYMLKTGNPELLLNEVRRLVCRKPAFAHGI
jgi:two-component system, OmpR family, alkaline phosphatase synthesis response regulator PhoP